MPLYDIEHVTPLSDTTQESLAQKLTTLHSTRFNTPSFFINVRYTDVSAQPVYRGGKRAFYNRAILRTRASENRSREEYAAHCKDVVRAWDELVVVDEKLPRSDERRLRCVWVVGALTVGVELGVVRPKVGEEESWLVENRSEFERLASEGDEDMKELVESLRVRAG